MEEWRRRDVKGMMIEGGWECLLLMNGLKPRVEAVYGCWRHKRARATEDGKQARQEQGSAHNDGNHEEDTPVEGDEMGGKEWAMRLVQ
jgi:hypothetical protein